MPNRAPNPTGVPRPTPNGASAPSTSSSQTITASSANSAGHGSQYIRVPPSGTLRLRVEAGVQEDRSEEPERRVQWADDVVNNEGMGKKSSKGLIFASFRSVRAPLTVPTVCCIYHKPRPVDESSEEESSDSSSDDESDGGNDDGSAKPSKDNKTSKHIHNHDHKGGSCDTGGKTPKRAPNAYEHIPKNG